MSASLIVLGLVALAISPFLISQFGKAKAIAKTQAEIDMEQKDKEEAKKAEKERGDKGALCNSFDFLFGEGACKGKNKNKKNISEDATNTSTDVIAGGVTFGGDTIDPKTGKIEGKPPTFTITQAEKDRIALLNSKSNTNNVIPQPGKIGSNTLNNSNVSSLLKNNLRKNRRNRFG